MAGADGPSPGVDQPPVSGAAPVRGLELRFASHPLSVPAVRRAVETFSSTHGLGEKAVADIGLCVNEAVANVIRHAYGGATDRPIHLRVEHEAGQVRVAIRDWGSGRNPADALGREHDPLRPGGLGMVCLRTLMDRVSFQPQPDGMLLILEKAGGQEGEEAT